MKKMVSFSTSAHGISAISYCQNNDLVDLVPMARYAIQQS
jgi:hypothetical protein